MNKSFERETNENKMIVKKKALEEIVPRNLCLI